MIAKKFKPNDSEEEDQKEGATELPGPDSESVPMELEGGSSSTTTAAASSSYDFGEGMPANFRGQYEIMGVVTHKGRSADSGAWHGWWLCNGCAMPWYAVLVLCNVIFGYRYR